MQYGATKQWLGFSVLVMVMRLPFPGGAAAGVLMLLLTPVALLVDLIRAPRPPRLANPQLLLEHHLQPPGDVYGSSRSNSQIASSSSSSSTAGL